MTMLDYSQDEIACWIPIFCEDGALLLAFHG